MKKFYLLTAILVICWGSIKAQYGRSTYVPPTLYHPNFEAIKSIWGAKQAQYNQGLSVIQKNIDSLNNTVSFINEGCDKRYREFREELSKTMQESLAKSDLSIKANVDSWVDLIWSWKNIPYLMLDNFLMYSMKKEIKENPHDKSEKQLKTEAKILFDSLITCPPEKISSLLNNKFFKAEPVVNKTVTYISKEKYKVLLDAGWSTEKIREMGFEVK